MVSSLANPQTGHVITDWSSTDGFVIITSFYHGIDSATVRIVCENREVMITCYTIGDNN
jgi:hypothetical protein